jgi:uncharacterized protein YciI
MAPKGSVDDRSLKRLGGGRWQTRDERFTIEPQSATWALVDAEQTDELGLPLVRGPYPSLTEAKAAIEQARAGEARSPLEARLEEARRRAPKDPATKSSSASPTRRAAGTPSESEQASTEPPRPEIPDGLSIDRVWVVEVPYTRDAAKRRAAVRHEHLERIGRLLAEGRLIEAGGYTDFSSASLMVRADSAEDALALVRDDVYLRSGVWREPLPAREYGRVVLDEKKPRKSAPRSRAG